MQPDEIPPSEADDLYLQRITVGGQFNRWLNISHVIVIQGAEDPDSKIFICEVCQARGTPSEQCNTTNFTLSVIGAPPVIKENLSKYLILSSSCISNHG